MLFPNLEAELKRRGVTRASMAKDFDLAISTVSARLSGISPMPMAFAKEIKKKYSIDVPLEELFIEIEKTA